MSTTTCCPQCGGQAHVHRRAVLESTDGPVEHATVRCVSGHCFFLPVAMLAERPTTSMPDASAPATIAARQAT